ncbi:MAG: choice-of-anchor D domain-containing protein [Acidobacteria bacterium]|nr:choice-of-anchor D domain-containing protein [Acidobacteriota bacterium]
MKVDAAGSALIYSSYLGGSGGERGRGIAVNASGNVYLTGQTVYFAANDFPVINALQPTYGGDADAFVVKLCGATLEPIRLTFSDQFVGTTSAEQAVSLTNLGIVPLTVASLAASGDFAQADTCAAPLPVGGSCTIRVVFRPSETGNRTGEVTITDDVCGNPYTVGLSGTGVVPVINPGGVVNGASFAAGAAVAPGSVASAFGSNLAPSAAGSLTVRMNEVNAPVFAGTSTQVNFQVPWERSGATQADMIVTVDGVTSSPVSVPLAALAPGLFSTNSSGSGQGVILIANTPYVAAPVGMFPGSRPVNRGGYISIYCTGLGPVTNQPATGVKASGDPLSFTTATPLVSVGGVPASVVFSGLAPDYFGLYQVNVQVPEAAPTGNAVPIALTIGGVTSNTVTIAVQ